ncbi:MAG TPA: hypothetical protein VFE84_01705 [Patescibacteria group bacterium]|nr:hypothetical protein [Patescibacteria group bacterium]
MNAEFVLQLMLKKIAGDGPVEIGYRDVAMRARTDQLIREHIAADLERLQAKVEELKTSATDEGEEDMLEDLDRLDTRLARTIEALRGADYSGVRFLAEPAVSEAQLGRVCSYDRALLEDLELLANDVMGMKYETIGNLTLREAEGTLAAIEMKVTNRKDAFDMSGEE